VQCQKLQQVFEVQSFGLDLDLDTGPQAFCYLFIALLSIICCLKSAQKFIVWMCQVASAVTETTQLVLSQLKNCLLQSVEKWITSQSLPKIINECWKLLQLCHISHMCPVFWDTVYTTSTLSMLQPSHVSHTNNIMHNCTQITVHTHNVVGMK